MTATSFREAGPGHGAFLVVVQFASSADVPKISKLSMSRILLRWLSVTNRASLLSVNVVFDPFVLLFLCYFNEMKKATVDG